tara:strand:- start:5437 stop:14220 length:8784 start_codon:yes stop_codon:yes gene_type:complete
LADNLTLRLQEELRRRGTAVDTATINNILRKNNISLPSSPSAPSSPTPVQDNLSREESLWESVGTDALPDWYEPSATGSKADGGVLNALGAGLWSFADTAAFGVPGTLVDEEDYLDFEDPLAKWLGAFGGFAGFVTGAPMRIGAKILQKGASAYLKTGLAPTKLQNRGLETVLKETKKIGLDGGLSRKAVRDLNKNYSNIVKKAQIDETLQAEKFGEAVTNWADNYIAMAAVRGAPLSTTQANAVRQMFSGSALTRPLQDFKGIARAMYGDTRYARWLGHTVNDVVMFSFIDGAMEGVQAGLVEGHKYDWTRLMWGGINGLAFSTLSILNPSGKASKFFQDFKIGVKAAFSNKNPYAKMDRTQLARTSRFIGESLERNGHLLDDGGEAVLGTREAGKKGFSTVKVRGKNVNLTSGGSTVVGETGTSYTLKEWERHFPDNTEEVMMEFLNQKRKWFGRQMMKWARREEVENLMQVWPRMIAGGLLFNTHSFYEMYAHDQEFDFAHDILPHFLIGAYVQRYSNPSKFDLNDAQMKALRTNLNTLGMNPSQLNSVPSLAEKPSEFENFFNRQDGKYKKVLDLAEKEGIISDDYNVVSKSLGKKESSVGLANNRNADFEIIYQYLNGRRAYTKGLDNISVDSARRIVDAFKESNPAVNLKSNESWVKMLDVESLKMTENLESKFEDILHTLKGVKFTKDGREYEITTKDDLLRVPEMITMSNELIDSVLKGDSKWIKGENGREKLQSLEDAFDSLRSVITMAGPNALARVKYDKINSVVEVSDLNTAKKIYETIRHEEGMINNMFSSKSEGSSSFSFANNMHEYAYLFMRNHNIRFSKKVVEIFKPEFKDKQTIQRLFKETGIAEFRDATGEILLVESVDQIQFEKPRAKLENVDKEIELNADRKRFLGRILAIQSMVGGYKFTQNKQVNIDPAKVDLLRNKLSELGYNESTMPMWLHKKIVDFAIRDKIEKTELNVEDVDSIVRLSELGMAKTSVDVTGKDAAGWRIRLLQEDIAFNEGLTTGMSKQDIAEYNARVRDIIDRSGGLISEYKDRARVTNNQMLVEMLDALPMTDSAEHPTSARVKVVEFLNLVGSSNIPNSGRFQNLSQVFLADGGTKAQMRYQRWLVQHGIMKLSGETRDWEIDLKKFNEEIQHKIGRQIGFFGVTPQYAERVHETFKKNARDRESLDSGEADSTPLISVQEFFKKYRIGDRNNDQSQESMEKQTESLDLWFKENDAVSVAITNTVNRLKDQIYVQANDGRNWVNLFEIRTNRRNKVESELVQELTYIIGSRRNQERVNLIKFNNGKLEYDSETQQKTRFHELLENIGIDSWWEIDPNAPAYILSKDGTRIERHIINIFEGDSNNLPKYVADRSMRMKDLMDSHLSTVEKVDTQDVGLGMMRVQILPNLPPIAIPINQTSKLVEPFREFVKRYDTVDSKVNKSVVSKMKKLLADMENGEITDVKLRGVDYEDILRFLTLENKLTGSDGNGLFIDLLNSADSGWNWNKILARGKLFNTKKFVRFDKDFIFDVANSQKSLGNEQNFELLRKRIQKGTWDVALWNDVQMADVLKEVDTYMKNKGLDKQWDSRNILGDAHMDVSAFDSIAYVSREAFREMQMLIGYHPENMNPIKPVISSGGPNSPLLLGKTLFVHSPELNDFFNRDHFGNGRKIDILLSQSGAKAYNPIIEGGKDVTLVNDVVWSGLKSHNIADSRAVRRLSIESIGFKPEKQHNIERKESLPTAKKSHADTNYMTPEEHDRYFADEIAKPLQKRLRDAASQLSEPIQTRQWMLNELGDEAFIGMQGTESTNTLNGIYYFSALTPDANPASYSKNLVKNKIMSSYIDPLMNNKRAVINQFMPGSSERYGGQASLVQAPIGFDNNITRLRPTTVTNSGQMLTRGEVSLPAYEADMSFSGLMQKGMEFRLVNNSKVYNKKEIRDLINELAAKEGMKNEYDNMISLDYTLGQWHEYIQYLGARNNMPDLQIGIIVRRNPRTRPNDMALMGLKGFMGKEYGTSMMVNSLDVVNVFEGDYDADKADYFFAEKRNMYDHIQRTSQYWVQGIDPSNLMGKDKYSFDLNSTDSHNWIAEYDANSKLFNKSIGLVQKVPRMLNYLGSLGGVDKTLEGTRYENNKILYKYRDREGVEHKLVMDYDNLDFHQNSALQTQYIIDGNGQINKDIARNIRTWRSDFLFPAIDKSIEPGEMKGQEIGFNNNMSRNGNSNGNRIRIFKKLSKVDGEWSEIDDMSRLDKAIVTEMMNQYGKILQGASDTVYEKSGEGRKATYDDAMNAFEGFHMFNSDMTKSLYYKLRNRTIPESGKDKWWSDAQFKDMFKPKPVGEGKDKYFIHGGTSIFMETFNNNARQIAAGERGSQIERVLAHLYDKNLFGDADSRLRTLTGSERRYIDEWYHELTSDMDMTPREASKQSERLIDNIKTVAFDINRKMDVIKDLKKKIVKISANQQMGWKKKQSSIDKINNIIQSIESELQGWLSKKYLKGRKSKDLEKIEFVDVDNINMKEGAIYWYTIDNIKRMMPLINGSDNWGLDGRALESLKEIKSMRKLFYGNQTNLSEMIKYGGRQLLSPEQRKFLEQFPDMNTYNEIETDFIHRQVTKHGFKWLWAFMEPSINKRRIGVKDGQPVPVPFQATEMYDPSSRYRAGLRFLTTMAQGKRIRKDDMGFEVPITHDEAEVAQRALSYIQMTQAHFERFMNNKFNMRSLISENIGEEYIFGDVATKKATYAAIRLPNFHKDFESRFGDFGTIEWNKTNERIDSGMRMLNDHNFEFYRQLMKAAGKEGEFDTYIERMTELENIMMGNEIINPIQYMEARRAMDVDVKNIAQEVLTKGIGEAGEVSGTEIHRKLKNNPIYALMGGSNFFKNLSLEPVVSHMFKLNEVAGRSKLIENVNRNIKVNESEDETFRRMKEELVEITTKCG